MIVGKGLIATTLYQYKNDEGFIIFASGVSNSAETAKDNFKREEELLMKAVSFDKHIVYFGTCSVYDNTLKTTPYVLHKLSMEKLITEQYRRYTILRLPTLIGKTNNPNTFFNSITSKLRNNEDVIVYKNASRYLIDVDELKWIVPLVLKHKTNTILNLTLGKKESVHRIIEYMSEKTKSNSTIQLIDKGFDLKVDNSEFKSMLDSFDENNYSFKNIIDKYL